MKAQKGTARVLVTLAVEVDRDAYELTYGEEFTLTELKRDLEWLVYGKAAELDRTHPVRLVQPQA